MAVLKFYNNYAPCLQYKNGQKVRRNGQPKALTCVVRVLGRGEICNRPTVFIS
jgi:hypothetical protein